MLMLGATINCPASRSTQLAGALDYIPPLLSTEAPLPSFEPLGPGGRWNRQEQVQTEVSVVARVAIFFFIFTIISKIVVTCVWGGSAMH